MTSPPLALLEGQEADAILADKAYDSNDLRETTAQMKTEAVIPSKRNRKKFIPHDEALYKQRIRSSNASHASCMSVASQRATTDAECRSRLDCELSSTTYMLYRCMLKSA